MLQIIVDDLSLLFVMYYFWFVTLAYVFSRFTFTSFASVFFLQNLSSLVLSGENKLIYGSALSKSTLSVALGRGRPIMFYKEPKWQLLHSEEPYVAKTGYVVKANLWKLPKYQKYQSTKSTKVPEYEIWRISFRQFDNFCSNCRRIRG